MEYVSEYACVDVFVLFVLILPEPCHMCEEEPQLAVEIHTESRWRDAW